MKFKLSKDWWTYNGLLWIATGLYLLITYMSSGVAMGTALGLAGINLLAGVALLQRSKAVFWIVFVLTIVGFVGQLEKITDPATFGELGFWLALLPLIFIIMLWQEIRSNEKKNS